MKIICITGIDGAGKSTLARNLVTALSKEGYSAHYIYGRIVPVMSRLLMTMGRFVFLGGRNPRLEFSEYSLAKKKVMRAPLLRALYTAAVFIDFYIQLWIKLCRYAFRNRVLVIDRYVYDTVISDLAVHLEYPEDKAMKIIEEGFRFIPRPELTVLLDLPEEVAYSRKTDIPHIDYLRERRRYYLRLQSLPGVRLMKGDQTQADLLTATLGAYNDHGRRER